MHHTDTDAAWAVITDSATAGFIEAVARKMARKGAPVDAEDFLHDLLCDIVSSWSQIHTHPKTGIPRKKPVNTRTFIYMRARKVRTYRNRAIEKERKFKSVGGLDTCTGRLCFLDGSEVRIPTDDIGVSPVAERQLYAAEILEVAADTATPEEMWALRTKLEDCSSEEVMARTGMTFRERDRAVEILGRRVRAAI